jgi:sulfur-oxidizing protein SoxY
MAGAGAGIASGGLAVLSSVGARAGDEAADLIERLTERKPVASDRLRLIMPAAFPSGYTVPMAIEVDTPMSDDDHVKLVRVLAPRNPIVSIAEFRFAPGRGVARVSTRVRLAAPQFVIAAAEMSDGSVLMAKTWVHVETNGCA